MNRAVQTEKNIVIAYHSQYGHTQRIAQAIFDGIESIDRVSAQMLAVEQIDDSGWRLLDGCDGIIFGAPTYMGGASGKFKLFADESSKIWFRHGWKDKLAGGFTCSGAMMGDKYSTLMYFVTLAMQHGMLWAGTAQKGADEPGDPDSENRLGSYIGLAAQADNVPPEQSPPDGDIQSAQRYGRRLASIVLGLSTDQ